MDQLYDIEGSGVFYCIFEDMLSGKIPINTILFVDEIDTFFFNDKP